MIYRQAKNIIGNYEEQEIFTKDYLEKVGGSSHWIANNGVFLKEPEDRPEPKTEIDYKFLVNFRRGRHYRGEYGFDWLREEYIEPIEKVLYFNSSPPIPVKRKSNGDPEATKMPLCIDAEKLKKEYEPFTRFGNQYYCSWLAIFPSDFPNSPHINGVELDIEIFDDFEENKNVKQPKEIEISFESNNANIEIIPHKVNSIKEAKKGVTIKCNKAIEAQAAITVKAVIKDGETQKVNEKIGQMFIYPNNAIKNIDITIVDCLVDDSSSKKLKKKRKEDLETYLNTKVLNQALIQCKIGTPEDFDLRKYKIDKPIDALNPAKLLSGEAKMVSIEELRKCQMDEKTLVQKYDLDKASEEKGLEIMLPSGGKNTAKKRVATNSVEDVEVFRDDLMSLYENSGKTKTPVRGKNDMHKFMFFVDIFVQMGKKEERFFIGKKETNSNVDDFISSVTDIKAFAYLKTALPIGNTVVFFTEQELENSTIAHEFGHNLGLLHLFNESSSLFNVSPYEFYKGYTDNFMDYEDRIKSTNEASDIKNKHKRLAYYRWQWDEMRKGL